MDTKSPRLTAPTIKILGALLQVSSEGISGADISKTTGISSGTLYPILFRLEKAEWLTSEWEEGNPTELGRPRRRLYTMTSTGLLKARTAFDSLFTGVVRFAWES